MMSGKALGVFALFTLLAAGPVHARQTNPTTIPEDGRIVGTVVDDANKPVAGALVMLGDGRSTETASDGTFSFVRVRPGAAEIAAVTRSCQVASGGFNDEPGRDSRLQLIVIQQAAESKAREQVAGTPTRRFDTEDLLALGDHSALEAIEELAPNVFRVAGSQLAIRARAVSPRSDVIEPLLLVDGVKMVGQVADALRTLRAADIATMDLHLGSAAGWEFQNGGSPAVIEITSRNKPIGDPFQNPAMCLRKGR
jgi:hypothetical protein